MKVTELTKEQLYELKFNYLLGVKCPDESVDWYDLANINDTVSNDEIYDYYKDCDFTDEDFFCTSPITGGK